ncbi:MAG: acyltransferase family protein, partial [Polaribacter sp.]
PFFHYLTYSILFAIIITNLAVNEQLKKVLEWNPINYLGRISYGIYMYHFLVMIFVLLFVSKFNIETNWVIYPLTILGTIGISSISYYYFETVFLKLKTKYTFIKSGGSKF